MSSHGLSFSSLPNTSICPTLGPMQERVSAPFLPTKKSWHKYLPETLQTLLKNLSASLPLLLDLWGTSRWVRALKILLENKAFYENLLRWAGMYSFSRAIKKLWGTMGSGCIKKKIGCGAGKLSLFFLPELRRWLSGEKTLCANMRPWVGIPSTHIKSRMLVCMLHPRAGKEGRDKKQGRKRLGISDSQHKWWAPDLMTASQWKMIDERRCRTPGVFLCPLCICMGMCTCVCMETHANTTTKRRLVRFPLIFLRLNKRSYHQFVTNKTTAPECPINEEIMW